MTIDEFKILLALNGNKRIEHLEEEIFSNEVFIKMYLGVLTSHWLGSCKSSKSIATHAQWYAWNFINARWIVAEPYIMKDPDCASYYALKVIKGRWIEAEQYIMKDANRWVWYCYNNCIKI